MRVVVVVVEVVVVVMVAYKKKMQIKWFVLLKIASKMTNVNKE